MSSHADDKDIGRLEMLSDGVFAIAITLLGLELKVPVLVPDERAPASLLSTLAAERHTYLALVTSFFTIFVMWLNHHGCIRLLKKVSVPFFFANGILFTLNLMWWAAARDWTNFRSEATHAVTWQIRRNALVGTGAYILAVASAFVSAFLCIAICTVLWIVWAATLVYFKGKLTK